MENKEDNSITQLYAQEWHFLIKRKNLPHALLIAGKKGLGQLELAKIFAQYLLCENEDKKEYPCGKCAACGWFLKNQHPDFRLVVPSHLNPQTDKKTTSPFILIEQIRQLNEFLYLSTHRQGLRVVLIYPAEQMNHNAANALLKSLEEPAPNTLFLLVSEQKEKLLPTIYSRTQELNLKTPSLEKSLRFLNQNNNDLKTNLKIKETALSFFSGAPILSQLALENGFFQKEWFHHLIHILNSGEKINPVESVKLLDKVLRDKTVDLIQIAESLQKWLVDLILLKTTGQNRFYKEYQKEQKNLVFPLSSSTLLSFYFDFLSQKQQLSQPLNAKLFLEGFLLEYRALFYNARILR